MVRRATRTARPHSSPGLSTAYRLGAKHPAATIARQTSQRIPGVLLHSRPVTVYTLGHSTRPLEALIALLGGHAIRGVADVRRFPASRRHPQFAREALERSLPAAGVRYDWLPALGGRRPVRTDSPHVGWREAGFRGYADHMDTPEFREGVAALLARAAERPTAIMCAEAVPWRCHRQLIADALVVRGVTVLHVIDAGAARPHALSRLARLEGDHIVYDAGHLPLRRSGRSGDAVP
jgi:uncharacterized protein (DUF488 family)